ncbi:MAG: nucleotidyltransferase family protein, partial [Rickettsiales bacterium]|nr:nucleotidyltransferase family protein [Rickettsiales bacterium]
MAYLEFLVEKLYRDFVTEDDAKLLALMSLKSPAQSDLDGFLKSWDIELASPHKVLLLAYFKKTHPEIEFPASVGPRLAGVMLNYSFKNVKREAQFFRAAKALLKVGIPAMLLKGGAMRHLRRGFPRVMGDIDFAVPLERYEDALAAVLGAGFSVKNVEYNSVDLMGPDGEWAIDLHRRILTSDRKTDRLTREMFGRARRERVFGADVLIPAHEDMAFISLCNLTKNLVKKNSLDTILFPMFDCAWLMQDKKDFDWGMVRTDMEQSGLAPQTQISIAFANRMCPNMLPEMKLSEREA